MSAGQNKRVSYSFVPWTSNASSATSRIGSNRLNTPGAQCITGMQCGRGGRLSYRHAGSAAGGRRKRGYATPRGTCRQPANSSLSQYSPGEVSQITPQANWCADHYVRPLIGIPGGEIAGTAMDLGDNARCHSPSTGRRTSPRHAGCGGSARRKAYASVKLRVTAGSTGMPGPVVVETTTFFR